MSTEIEAKLKVKSHKKVIARLTELGAEFLEKQSQTDCYFDDADKSLTKTDRCLRLRRQLTGQKEKIFLTYKGAREKNEFKKRPEVEIEVSDADSTEKLLWALEYEKELAFEKNRQVWRVGDCIVSLDELPLLGGFVEIEGPDERIIADMQRDLGLSDLPHIVESYAALVSEKLRQSKIVNRK